MQQNTEKSVEYGGNYQKYRGFNVDLQMFPNTPENESGAKDLTRLFYGNDQSSSFGAANENQFASNLTGHPAQTVKIEDYNDQPFVDMSDFDLKPRMRKTSLLSGGK